jgi:hypothetical protein
MTDRDKLIMDLTLETLFEMSWWRKLVFIGLLIPPPWFIKYARLQMATQPCPPPKN